MYAVDIPRTVDDVTPEWLTEALQQKGTIRDTAVESFDSTELPGGAVGTIHRLDMRYSSSQSQGPESVIIKLPIPEIDLATKAIGFNRSESTPVSEGERVEKPVLR
jgi:hypothetical protein